MKAFKLRYTPMIISMLSMASCSYPVFSSRDAILRSTEYYTAFNLLRPMDDCFYQKGVQTYYSQVPIVKYKRHWPILRVEPLSKIENYQSAYEPTGQSQWVRLQKIEVPNEQTAHDGRIIDMKSRGKWKFTPLEAKPDLSALKRITVEEMPLIKNIGVYYKTTAFTPIISCEGKSEPSNLEYALATPSLIIDPVVTLGLNVARVSAVITLGSFIALGHYVKEKISTEDEVDSQP